MDKTRKEIMLTGILVVVFLAVGVNSCQSVRKKVAKKKQYQKQAEETKLTSVTAKAIMPQKTSEADSLEEDIYWKRDPFSGAAYKAKKVGGDELDFGGVLWSDDGQFAIINGKMYQKGDSVGKFTVKEIKEESVILSDGDDYVELNVW